MKTKAISVLVLLLMVLYLASYFALVERAGCVGINEVTAYWPSYHGVPSALFFPVHQLDIHVLRPDYWCEVGPPIQLTDAEINQLGIPWNSLGAGDRVAGGDP